MAIHSVGASAVTGFRSSVPVDNAFARALQKARGTDLPEGPLPVAQNPGTSIPSGPVVVSPPGRGVAEVHARHAVSHVLAAQKRLDDVLVLAQSGKTFTPAELLALQAQVYRSSQELDLAGKVVEKVSSGIKQILQTQL